MKANLASREPEILARWAELNLYRRLRIAAKDKARFILHDGPPYANARPHLGTALNKILKDIVVKAKTLSGFDAPFVPGWDCHGLPIELNVEKEIGKAGAVSPEKFRKACREYAASQVEIQKEDFKRLGVLADWEQPYLTMDAHYEANTVRALAQILEKGYLQPGYKPVYWCTACGSSLAEAEVEYQEKTSPAIDVAFEADNLDAWRALFPDALSGVNRVVVPIWTTTPWTLPANQAVALNPHFEYVLVTEADSSNGVAYVCAQTLLPVVMQRYGIENYRELATVKGEALEGLALQHPFISKRVNIILGDHVTAETGTGCVHTAPDHGQEDYVVGQKYNLHPSGHYVSANGCFDVGLPLELARMHVFKANDRIIEILKTNHKLLHQTTIQHSYPHCWRHKMPLIFRATRQWFIIMEDLRQQSLDAIEKVTWLPAAGKNRIHNMLESRPDWCISRQRLWGVPIPLFVDKQHGAPHKQSVELMLKIADRVEQSGLDAWFNLDPSELLGAEAKDYEKITDTCDVWFDSGVSHFCVLQQRADLRPPPADLYLEGSDQHRGWFQTSLLTSLAIHDKAPYKTVLTHGYVVDGQGRKMSKSLGNVIAPIDVVKNLGADILRLWVASSDYKLDINYSEEIIKRNVDAYRRIRNTARFLLANIFDFDPEKDAVPAEKLLALDTWAIAETERLQQDIIQAYNDYSFQTIYQKIHNFCSVQMGSFYLDIIKDRQYTSYRSGLPRRSAQTAMWIIIESLVRCLAPILSFTAEEIWRYLPGNRADSVFLATWYDHFPSSKNKTQIAWTKLIPIRDAVNKILEAHRQAGEIGSALDAEVILYAGDEWLCELTKLGDELRFVLITSGAQALPAEQRDSSSEASEAPGLWVTVKVSAYEKCVRCWQRRPDVGRHAEHPSLCGRCVTNIVGPGESRHFA